MKYDIRCDGSRLDCDRTLRNYQILEGNWKELAMAIENEMFKIRVGVGEPILKPMPTSTGEAMLAAFSRVQQIMKNLEGK